jgi:hypothetical protein
MIMMVAPAPTGNSRRGAVAEAERVVDGAVVVLALSRRVGGRRVRARSRPDATRVRRIPDSASRLVHPWPIIIVKNMTRDTVLYCFKCNNCDYCNDCYHENYFLEDNNNKMYYLECDTAWTGIRHAQCHPSAL